MEDFIAQKMEELKKKQTEEQAAIVAKKKEEEAAAAKVKAEQEAAAAKVKAEQEAAEAKKKQEEEAAAAKVKAEQKATEARMEDYIEKKMAELKKKQTEEQAAIVAKKKEEEAAAAKVKAEQEAAEAKKKQEEEAAAAKVKAEQEAAEAKKKQEEEAAAAKVKAEQEAAAAKVKAEQEAAAAKVKAEQEAAAAKKKQEEEAAAKLKAEIDSVPKLIFIVPYRDRQQHKEFFANHMKKLMEDYEPNSYKIYYIHQTDKRTFNRGGMKNIGFLMVKDKYPKYYKDITLVFNDVDTMPYTKNFLNYNTTQGVVKHFYGYKFALGGIVSIKAGDFEKTNGFPNFWAWGYEDNLLKKRVEASGLRISYDQFYPIHDKNILQMKDGFHRIINRKEYDAYMANTSAGIRNVSNLKYTVNDGSGFVDVTAFDVENPNNPEDLIEYDARKGNRPFGKKRQGSMKMAL
jgi:transcription-repair coupling factor (superfamily II helicase)